MLKFNLKCHLSRKSGESRTRNILLFPYVGPAVNRQPGFRRGGLVEQSDSTKTNTNKQTDRAKNKQTDKHTTNKEKTTKKQQH